MIERSPELAQALNAIASGVFSPDDPNRYKGLMDGLLDHDWFMVAADFDAYHAAQRGVEAVAPQVHHEEVGRGGHHRVPRVHEHLRLVGLPPSESNGISRTCREMMLYNSRLSALILAAGLFAARPAGPARGSSRSRCAFPPARRRRASGLGRDRPAGAAGRAGR